MNWPLLILAAFAALGVGAVIGTILGLSQRRRQW